MQHYGYCYGAVCACRTAPDIAVRPKTPSLIGPDCFVCTVLSSTLVFDYSPLISPKHVHLYQRYHETSCQAPGILDTKIGPFREGFMCLRVWEFDIAEPKIFSPTQYIPMGVDVWRRRSQKRPLSPTNHDARRSETDQSLRETV